MTYQAPPPYGQPQPQQHRGGSGMAITALVLGVLALLTCWTVVGGIFLGLVAIILGFIASSRAKHGRAGGRAMAIIGIVTGALGLVISIGLIALGASLLNSDTGQNLQDCLQDAGQDETAQAECQREFQEELTN
jgi:Domain of unknown function (DUF4190)